MKNMPFYILRCLFQQLEMSMRVCHFCAALLSVIIFMTNLQGEEWISLFNGKDLSGWTVQSVPVDQDKNFWSVVDGAIQANSLGQPEHDYVWLLTNKEYQDFILQLKFQAFKESPGNSGVQIRSRYDEDAGWLDGPQIDIHPPGYWRCGMIWDETRENKRWLYPEIPADAWVDSSMAVPGIKFFFSNDEPAWNELQITARGTQLKAVMNGATLMQWDGDGVLNDKIHQKYNVGMNGFIALQIHKNDELKIRFKDIKIKELK